MEYQCIEWSQLLEKKIKEKCSSADIRYCRPITDSCLFIDHLNTIVIRNIYLLLLLMCVSSSNWKQI